MCTGLRTGPDETATKRKSLSHCLMLFRSPEPDAHVLRRVVVAGKYAIRCWLRPDVCSKSVESPRSGEVIPPKSGIIAPFPQESATYSDYNTVTYSDTIFRLIIPYTIT
jgi:hypothetical protein